MNPTPLTLAVPPLSQSRYELMACPQLYIERVIQGRKEPNNPWALRGTMVHAVLASYLTHLVQTRQPSDYVMFDTFTERIDGEARDVLDDMKESLVIDPERSLGAEVLLTLDENLSPVGCFRGDTGAYGCWYDESGNPNLAPSAFEGTLDYVQAPNRETIEIWDWKSYYQIIDADTFQAKFYPLLVFKHFPGAQTVRFHLKFVRYGATRSIEFTRRDDLPKLEKMARAARARQIDLHRRFTAGEVGRDLEPTPGSQCTYCPCLQQECQVREANPYGNMDPEDRVKFGIWLLAAKKQNDEVLKDWVKVRGPVETTDSNGRRYAAQFELRHCSSYPLEPTYQIVKKHDPELIEKLTVGELSSPLKAKKRAALAEELAAVKTLKAQTRFVITGCEDSEDE